MFLSVVAPCFNEEDGLEEFYLRLKASIGDAGISSYEVLLVDDGSSDRTWDIIRMISHRDKHIRGIKLSRNFGHQAALTAGLDEADGDYIFIIDSDLQDPPELLEPMLIKMKNGFDVVYGQRKRRSGENFFKLTSAKFFYRFLSLMADVYIPKDTGDFRLINRRVLNSYKEINESQRFTRGLIAWLGFKQVALPYDRHPRFAGNTKYPLMKMINFSIDAVTGFSLKPLRMIIILGLITSGVSFLAFVYSIYQSIFFNTVPGWASLMTVVCLIGCVQIICLGVVGEYVGRTFIETKKRPLYLIQEKADQEVSSSHQLDSLKQKILDHQIQEENFFH
jgi:glycosyltransferase involved in cell wall biosynthesis